MSHGMGKKNLNPKGDQGPLIAAYLACKLKEITGDDALTVTAGTRVTKDDRGRARVAFTVNTSAPLNDNSQSVKIFLDKSLPEIMESAVVTYQFSPRGGSMYIYLTSLDMFEYPQDIKAVCKNNIEQNDLEGFAAAQLAVAANKGTGGGVGRGLTE